MSYQLLLENDERLVWLANVLSREVEAICYDQGSLPEDYSTFMTELLNSILNELASRHSHKMDGAEWLRKNIELPTTIGDEQWNDGSY